MEINTAPGLESSHVGSQDRSEILKRSLEAVGSLDFRLPAEEGLGPRDVWPPSLGIVLGKFLENDLARIAIDHREDFVRQFQHRDFAGIADVDRLNAVGKRQAIDAVDQVGDEAEASGLVAPTENSQGFTAKRLAHHRREHSTVVEPHARSVGVKDPNNPGLHPVVAVVGHRDGLGEALRLVVAASRSDRVDVAPVILALRMDFGVAVDLRRTGQKEPRVLRLGQTKRVVGSQRTDLQGRDRMGEVVRRARGAGEMQNVVDRLINPDGFGDVVFEELKFGIVEQVGDVFSIARQEVVHADHAVPLGEKSLAKV